uniref:Ribonuclease H-like domain, reverse transcriptase, RNA-dependent DNA polymerase n=1 Tax=Tanacetum cinerariifolium TaxID=118510 RepID=A0A699GGE8_TANCI|nr:ribonuclease H-like domain, reverse transcriptase, RNA-dependent DNA polymerase [Tanacetum cinerariifolium]
MSEHINDEPEWTDFKKGNLEVTNGHHDQGIQPIEEDNEFTNNDDDDYASPTRDSPTHSQAPHTPSTRSSQDYGITYKHNGGSKIHGFSDSSYGVNTQERKVTTGIIFYYGKSPLSWSTRKQATVALSSCESEFIAATAATTQALWLKRQLSKLTHSKEEKVTIRVDGHNSGTILNHSAQVFKHVTPVDETQIPTGEITPVEGTPFDFTTKKKIGNLIHKVGKRYDHNYILDCI